MDPKGLVGACGHVGEPCERRLRITREGSDHEFHTESDEDGRFPVRTEWRVRSLISRTRGQSPAEGKRTPMSFAGRFGLRAVYRAFGAVDLGQNSRPRSVRHVNAAQFSRKSPPNAINSSWHTFCSVGPSVAIQNPDGDVLVATLSRRSIECSFHPVETP